MKQRLLSKFATTIGKRSGIGLFQDNAIEKLADYTAHDMSLQLDMIEDFILPEIKESQTELTATSQAFSLIFGTTKGFSGTPWNWQTFPKGTLVSAISGTDGAALVPLYEKGADRVFEVSTKQDNKVTSLFNDNPSFKNAQVFIDSAGILRGIPHQEVAKQLFTLDWFRDAFDGVVFFDEKENKMIFEKATNSIVSPENSHIPLHKRFIFFDQKHTTRNKQSSKCLTLTE